MSTAGKVITCKAAVCWAAKQPLVIETVEVDPPKANEVRIKVIATGVCHSDANIMHGNDALFRFPIILGHEGAGIVESVGEGVTNFKPGDHVIPTYIAECNSCVNCKRERTNLCHATFLTLTTGVLHDGTTRFSCKGQRVNQFMGCGTFSEYTVVSALTLVKIDERAPLDKVCLLGCAIPTGYGGAVNVAQVKPGDTCAVWGLGAVGLAAVMGCKANGATRIIGVDINPAKFDVSKQFGCTEFVNPADHTKSTQDVITEITGGGADCTIECCGNVNTMKAALEAARPAGGIAVVIGLAPPQTQISVTPTNLHMGRIFTGAIYGNVRPSHLPGMIEKYMKKELMIDEFITHNMGLDEINTAFDLMMKGTSIRTVIKHSD